ncbi:MAG: hypothetical protein LBM97_01870 [Candidatus Nomurabacteria bacterium]|jgi:hypothetical protein|nr:hypothetical protein [Candidatus Nomurabacteria bacterium]
MNNQSNTPAQKGAIGKDPLLLLVELLVKIDQREHIIKLDDEQKAEV